MKTIGMLGGMGPESTSYTYMRLIRYCQERYGARLDSDFPPIIMYSMPVPDVVEEGSDDQEVLARLDEGLGRLMKAGASFSFIACNTMQGFIPSLRKKYDLLSIVDETVREASAGPKNWGILATPVTVRKGFYQQAFRKAGLNLLAPSPSDQKEVTSAIREILAGTDMARPCSRLTSVVRSLEKQGTEGVLLACTDLPIAIRQDDMQVKLLDTADVIARASVERWRRQ